MENLGQLLFDFVDAARTSYLTTKEAEMAVRKEFITQVLTRCNFNKCKAAREMQLHRNTLGRMIRELGLDVKAMKLSNRKPPTSADRIERVMQRRA